MKSPDIDAIRAFLLVAQFQSFTRVADTLGTTQAAISLKIKRLEEAVGRALLDRTPRRVTLSAHGQAFHANAQRLLDSYNDAMGSFDTPKRTLRIGVSHHIVGADLSGWLQRLMAADPQVVIAFSLGTSRELLEGYEQGKLDVALVLRHDNRRQDGDVIGAEHFTWMAAPGLQVPDDEPLPLAIQPAPCGMRSMVSNALQAHDRAWREAFVGSGILAIGAAVEAGIGIGAMVGRMAPANCEDVTTRFGLPELSMRDVVLYTTHHDAQVRGLIDTLVAAMRHAGYSSRLASVANSIASPERATAQSTKAAR
jgi:DNA-binding transcriptional LysR family regulator